MCQQVKDLVSIRFGLHILFYLVNKMSEKIYKSESRKNGNQEEEEKEYYANR